MKTANSVFRILLEVEIKQVTFSRRQLLALSAAAGLTGMAAATLPASAAEGDMHDPAKLMQPAGTDKGYKDRVLGDENAKVTVIEYASPTCPHCARFAIETLPEFTKQYVDTGKVKLIVRPFIRDVRDAVIFMLAETADTTEGYLNILDTYFKSQGQWGNSDKPKDALLEIALQLGFTKESFEAALTNQDLFAGMNAVRDQAINEFGLEGTPTFYINGKQISGEKTVEDLAKEIDPLL